MENPAISTMQKLLPINNGGLKVGKKQSWNRIKWWKPVQTSFLPRACALSAAYEAW